jgi:hypothetical protein
MKKGIEYTDALLKKGDELQLFKYPHPLKPGRRQNWQGGTVLDITEHFAKIKASPAWGREHVQWFDILKMEEIAPAVYERFE